MPIATRLVVFSDLDGTLLDHDGYRWDAAMPALGEMQARGIPLILASSKTGAEIAELRDQMGFAHCPAIVENGAGILAPHSSGATDNAAHTRIIAALDSLPAPLRAGFSGFTDWTVSQVAEDTGLPEAQAKLARARQFSEPGHWNGPPELLDDFLAALFEMGVSARRGGRYLTLSFGATKASQMANIMGGFDPNAATMALGDAPNDVEMIEAADIGVIVKNPHGPGIEPLDAEKTGRITRTDQDGPKGWNQTVLATIGELYDRKG
ncbi:mannosyl-3-phosphoglycerate phosphatase-related protein [Celeribacter arenosi]|uniref:Mannosyl-3-phosphoglycerate phosphatase-related protein n=1 Tax=Celeribacter arenosi TaxID=792649 RepID=A0ABP7JWX5_9RHOB